jgi:putative tryptophan/tyrosine transport system substrate-binding protein
VKRREFITLLGGAATASSMLQPLAARAQQRTLPVVGFLSSGSPDAFAHRLRAFRQGLKEAGYVEGDNVEIVYRWAEGQNDRLPMLAADLARRQVTVMTPFGSAATIAAKSATTTIPIVFAVDDDPVRLGLVASLARPNGNLTGLNFFATELAEKRLELLRELVPTAARVAVLVNPTYPNAEPTVRDVTTAAHARGLQIEVHNASTSQEINAVFASLGRDRPGALFVAGDPLFVSRRIQMILLATRLAVPASYSGREFPDAGGLMSYGTNIAEAWRQTGAYAGRVLKGAKPADLPVVRSSKFELVINAETARMLGLTVPPTLLATADEVIE